MDNRNDNPPQPTQLSDFVEQNVRQLIGELNMQVIVLKGMMEAARQQAQAQEQALAAQKDARVDRPVMTREPMKPAEPIDVNLNKPRPNGGNVRPVT